MKHGFEGEKRENQFKDEAAAISSSWM